MTTTPPSSSEKLGFPQSTEGAIVFKPFRWLLDRSPWIGRRGSPPEEMFGVSVDNIILGVMVIAAVLLIAWIKRQ
jgi:hypothetical protein